MTPYVLWLEMFIYLFLAISVAGKNAARGNAGFAAKYRKG